MSLSQYLPIASRTSSAIGLFERRSAAGSISTLASSGSSDSKASAIAPGCPARYPDSLVLSRTDVARIGEPASSPRNSPICHWRVSIHSASRTSAFSALSIFGVRGRPSSRFQPTRAGNSLADTRARSLRGSVMASFLNEFLETDVARQNG